MRSQIRSLLPVDLIGAAAHEELGLLGGHQLPVLLPHGLAEGIGLAEGEAGEIGGQPITCSW